ncbi:MAG: TetR/AcrR family transcriptional regulator [Methanomassiliicoccales archaeon]|jgi:AcrR family transcriptional regulator
MGVQDRRRREREAREAAILAAARELFISEGYEGASIDKIAAKLELSKRTIYLYFDSKDELYYAVAKASLVLMAKMFREAVERERIGLRQFAGIGLAYAEFWEKHQDSRRLLNIGAFVSSPREPGKRRLDFEQASSEVLGLMVRAIEQGIRDGSIRKELDPTTTALCISSSMQGVLQALDSQDSMFSSVQMPRRRFVAETLDLFSTAIAAPGHECQSFLETMNGAHELEEGGKRE